MSRGRASSATVFSISRGPHARIATRRRPGRFPPIDPVPEGRRDGPEETRRPVVGAQVHPARNGAAGDPLPRGKLVPGARPEEDLEVGPLPIERHRGREDAGEADAAPHQPPRTVLAGELETVPERQREGEGIAGVEAGQKGRPAPDDLVHELDGPFSPNAAGTEDRKRPRQQRIVPRPPRDHRELAGDEVDPFRDRHLHPVEDAAPRVVKDLPVDEPGATLWHRSSVPPGRG